MRASNLLTSELSDIVADILARPGHEAGVMR
jgi:hypothetical protein